MYEIQSRLRFSETDKYRKMTISAMINYFQDLATFHSKDSGVWNLTEDGNPLGWIVLSWDIKIREYPVMGDELRVVSYPLANKGLFAFRDFIIYRGEEALVAAHSVWSLIDLTKLCPRKISDDINKRYGVEEPIPGKWCSRKLDMPAEKEEKFSFSVEKFQLDTNDHMNNERYVSAAFSLLPEGMDVKEVQVSYINQAVYRERLHVFESRSFSDKERSNTGENIAEKSIVSEKDGAEQGLLKNEPEKIAFSLEKEDGTVCCVVIVKEDTDWPL